MSPAFDPKRGHGPDASSDRPETGRRAGGASASGEAAAAPPEGTTEEEVEHLPNGGGGFFPELLRRGLTLGFTGVFMTEEAVRRALGDSVPRDLIEFVVAQSDRTRAELLDRLSREFGRVLSTLDPAEVARRLLEGRTIEVEARFRLVPEPREGAGPTADAADAGRTRSRGTEPEEEDEEPEEPTPHHGRR